MWKTRLLNDPDKIAFQTPDLQTGKYPVIQGPQVVCLKKKKKYINLLP